MADQGRWFKLWCSALSDDDLSNLDISDFGRWAKLGAHIKEHGTAGSLRLMAPCRQLCGEFQVADFDALMCALHRLPGLEICNGEGVTNATVTLRNWPKYQGDNSAERTRRWRYRVTPKKRREEKREEEKDQNLTAPIGPEVLKPSKKPPDPNVKTLIDTYSDSFFDRFKSRPPINGKTGKIAAQILSGRPVEQALWAVTEYFSDPPPWYFQRELWGLEHVLAALPSLLARNTRP